MTAATLNAEMDTTVDLDTTVGLRERKKAATRQALHEAALRLAIEHGLERLTVEAIADAASVSRRTFSNYFANKEEAIFHGHRARLRAIVDLLRAQPEDVPVRRALFDAARAFSAELDGLDPALVAQRRLVRGHPSLVVHQVAAHSAVERELADELASRMPADDPEAALRARVLSAAFLTTLRAATQHWIENPDRPLSDVLLSALRHVAG